MTTDFDALRAANPYRNQSYNKSGWQNFLSSLGFRTQADAWKENLSVQAAEYDAAIAQKQFDTEYESASEQSSRLKQAGLNPDLNPSMVSAGDAGAMGQDMSTPMLSTGEEEVVNTGAKICLDVASFIMSGFTSGLGLVSSLQGIYSNRLNNRLSALNNESAFQDFVGKTWKTFLPDSPEDETMLNDFDWKAQALKNAENFSGQLPRKLQKKFVDNVSRYWSSAPGNAEAYRAWRDRVVNRRDFYQEYQTNYSDIDTVLAEITEPFAKLSEKIYKQSLKTDLAQAREGEVQANNEAEYFEGLDASLQAENENAANSVSKMNSEMVNDLNSTISEIISNLKRKSEEGGITGSLAQIALVVCASARLWLSSVGAPSVSRSTSVSHTDTMTRNSRNRKDSQSSSFNLSF